MKKRKSPLFLTITLIVILVLIVADAVFIYKSLRKSIIFHYVPLYSQGDTNLCWAYCQLMIEDGNEFRIRNQKSADQRVRKIVEDSYGTYDADLEASPINARDLRINSMKELHKALEEYGPLYAEYDRYENGERRDGHAVVVTGVNLISGRVYTNNPWGIRGNQSFEEFKSEFAGTKDGEWYFMGYYYLE